VSKSPGNFFFKADALPIFINSNLLLGSF